MAAQKQLKLPRKKTVNARLNKLEKIRKKKFKNLCSSPGYDNYFNC